MPWRNLSFSCVKWRMEVSVLQAVNISRELKLAVALSPVCLGMCREALQCCTVKREKERERGVWQWELIPCNILVAIPSVGAFRGKRTLSVRSPLLQQPLRRIREACQGSCQHQQPAESLAQLAMNWSFFFISFLTKKENFPLRSLPLHQI